MEVENDDLEKKLQDINAKKFFDGILDTIYFDNREVPTLKSRGMALRIRRVRGIVYITSGSTKIARNVCFTVQDYKVKKPKPTEQRNCLGSRDKIEYRVLKYEGDYLDVLRDSFSLGYEEKGSNIKHRTTYKLDQVNFELDKIKRTKELGDIELPLMLEVQTPEEQLTKGAIQMLGYDLNDKRVVDWSLDKIFRYYAGKYSDVSATIKNDS